MGFAGIVDEALMAGFWLITKSGDARSEDPDNLDNNPGTRWRAR
jgi:hypothetical protein